MHPFNQLLRLRATRLFLISGAFLALGTSSYQRNELVAVAKAENVNTPGATTKKATPKLSPYDKLFAQEAERLGYPWQFLAAIAYHESGFSGTAGVGGLMGILPSTGRRFGASRKELLDPKVSVRIAVDCLRSIDKLFVNKIPDPEERMLVALAAYNIGATHVLDAIALAKKHGLPATQWAGGIEQALQLKRQPKYYQDPVCSAGALRHNHVFSYVNKVYNSFQTFQERTETDLELK